jgi:RNA polymerase sigma-70 factor (ECF subfamily)
MAESNHAELVARMARGDDDAFAALYRIYLPLVLRWSVRAIGDRELAADLTAEVFAAALLASRRYRPEAGPVAAWLVGIANNKLRESRRKRRVEDSARRRLGLEPVALTDTDLERVDELVGMNERLDALLAELPAQQREAVVARVIEERSYEEIAAELQCSPSVIRQRVSRGLRSLRSELEEP